MALAPAPKLAACLEVLYSACIYGRLLGYEGERDGLSAEQSQELAALMDAVHNIPDLLQRWEDCNEELLRAMLRDFDERWGRSNREGLLSVYDQGLQEKVQQAASADPASRGGSSAR